MSERVETLIVGAGISGLSAAYRLGAGACLVLEATQRVGGLIHTVEGPHGLRYESGPETISDAEGDALALMEELGLEVQRAPAQASKRFLALGGRLHEIPLSPPKLLLGGLLPLAARLRLMCEPLRARDQALEGSVADFMLHRVGRGVLETLVDPMLSGIHGAAPEELSMRACFPQLVRGVEEHGSLFAYLRSRSRQASGGAPRGPWRPAGGMTRLPERLAQELGAALRLGTRVDSIEPSADGWRVRAGEQSFEARRLVLATSQRVTGRLLAQVAPRASKLLREAQNETLSVHVSAHRREDVEHALDGFGYLVPSSQGLGHLGTLFSSSLDPSCAPEGLVLLRTMLGGSRWPEVQQQSDEQIAALVEREVSPLLGLRKPPLFSHTTHYIDALPRYDLEQPARVAALNAELPPGLQLLGNYLQGIGIPALIRQADYRARLDLPN